MDRVINHSSHWRSWKQVGQFVECEKCNVLLYEGDAPNDTKRILMEVLSRENTDMPVLDERADMPNTTNQPPNRTIRVAEPPVEETYESDLNYDPDYREGEVTPVTTNGQKATESYASGQAIASKEVGSSDVNVSMAYVEITSTFSRTIADPGNDRFGSVTAGLSVKEMFPGEMSAMDIANIAEGHYIITKEKVLSQLQLPFQQDQATGMILEAFPGARTVSSTPVAPPAPPPTEPARPPQGRFGTSRTAQPQQASSGARSAPGGWEPAPSQAELKRELLDYPHLWYPDPSKSPTDAKPDFLSTHYKNDRGYPAGIWVEGSRGPNFTADELDTLYTIAPEDFAQTRPRAPR